MYSSILKGYLYVKFEVILQGKSETNDSFEIKQYFKPKWKHFIHTGRYMPYS
jgi:hypothetical protein